MHQLSYVSNNVKVLGVTEDNPIRQVAVKQETFLLQKN